MIIFGIMYQYKKVDILSRVSLVHYKEITEHASVFKMDKKRLKFTLVVSDAAKGRVPQTKEFIDDTLK